MEPKARGVPNGWDLRGTSPRKQMVELNFAVKHQNVDLLHDTLMRVSTPSSPTYGMHLSNDEVHQMIAPKPEHIAAVIAFLKEHGADVRPETPNHDMISAVVPVETAELMLGAKYVQLEHKVSGVVVHRTPEGYTLPTEVAAAVDFVTPTVRVPGV